MSSSDLRATVLQRVGGRTAVDLLLVTVAALALRLYGLGERFAHWDEARVGYWILRYQETGEWSYHPIIHGPFFPQVNRILFELFGASDFVARLPVAVVSGVAPLAALLYRDHLRRTEVVAFGLLLAVNPVLLYYSRFMRNDVLLAAFMLFALGFFLRAHATRKRRYLFAGVAALGLAFTTKENVLLYLLSWLGAGVLLLDHRLFLAREGSLVASLPPEFHRFGNWWARLFVAVGENDRASISDLLRSALAPVGLVVALLLEFLTIIVLFYAPRTPGSADPGILEAVSDPTVLPVVVWDATVGSWQELFGEWVNAGHQKHAYLPYFDHFVSVLEQGALPLVVLAVVGFVAARYVNDLPRDLVNFAFYWGAVSVLGYPLVTDIKAPWATVHAIAPLAIPAAVGAALVYRWSVDAYESGDAVSTALSLVVVAVLVWQVAIPAVSAVYLHPQSNTYPTPLGGSRENVIVQGGQPADGINAALADVRTAVKSNDEGTDVLYYGFSKENGDYVFYVPNEASNNRWPAAKSWYNRLPVPWYTELYDAEVNSTLDPADVASERPPVVITRTKTKGDINQSLDGYKAYHEELTIVGSYTTIYVKKSALRDANATDAAASRRNAVPPARLPART